MGEDATRTEPTESAETPDAPASEAGGSAPRGRAKRRRMGRWFTPLLTLPLALVGALAILYAGGSGEPTGLRIVLAAVYAGMVVFGPLRERVTTRGLGTSAGLFAMVALWWATHTPQPDRTWWEPQSRAPWAEFSDASVTIHDVRDFRWNADGTWEAAWYDATYDLNTLDEGYFVLTRFAGEAVAHVMASFRFAEPDGDRYLTLSVEIRREDGESYDPLAGMFRQYELMYVAADERDAIGVRTHVHGDPTWVIPLRAGHEKTRAFFVDMVQRMTAVRENPEWYNTLTNSCSTNLADHYERVNDVSLPPDWRVTVPGYSDRLIEELGLLPDGMTLEQARAAFLIDERATAGPLDENYSERIRAVE